MRLIALLLHGLQLCLVVVSVSVWCCYAHAMLLLHLQCGVATLMLRCCFLVTVWGCYAYATLLLPFHCVGLIRLCYVVTSFSLCGVVTLMLRCYFLFAVALANFALQEMQDDPGEQLKKMLRRRHDGPNIFLQETTPILILLLCATIFDK